MWRRVGDVAAYYNLLAECYDELYGEEQIAKYNLVMNTVYVSGDVLDVGCGTGMFLDRVHSGGFRVGVDVSLGMLHVCKRRHGYSSGRIDLVAGDAHMLPFRAGCFNYVFMYTVFQNLALPLKAFREAYRVLRDGGVFAVTLLKRVKGLLARALFLVEEAGFNGVRLMESAESVDWVIYTFKGKSPVRLKSSVNCRLGTMPKTRPNLGVRMC